MNLTWTPGEHPVIDPDFDRHEQMATNLARNIPPARMSKLADDMQNREDFNAIVHALYSAERPAR